MEASHSSLQAVESLAYLVGRLLNNTVEKRVRSTWIPAIAEAYGVQICKKHRKSAYDCELPCNHADVEIRELGEEASS